MSIVVLDGTKIENMIVQHTLKILDEQNEDYTYFKLGQMDIKPCINCNGCKLKTPGRCVFDDDMHEILYKVVKSSIVIMLTPIVLGGYSYNFKKALDKFGTLAYPTFAMKNGKLTHPPIYNEMSSCNFVIGISDNTSEDEKQSFKRLVAENRAVTGGHFHDLMIELFDDSNSIKQILHTKLNEVKGNG